MPAERERDERPYQLAESQGYICASGPEKILRNLRVVPGAQVGALPDGNPFIYYPVNRTNFLITEAVGAPVTVSPQYQVSRDQAMQVDKHIRLAVATELISYSDREMLPHQLDFLVMVRNLRGALNASEQGTGKTMVGWMSAMMWHSRRVLIVCPKSNVLGWQREHQEIFGKSARIQCEALGDDSCNNRGVRLSTLSTFADRCAAIVNYEAVRSMFDYISGYRPDLIICDESWKVKSGKAQVTQAMMDLAEHCPHVLCLTGTPIGNDVGDLWSQLKICAPDAVPMNYFQFVRRYANMVPIRLHAQGRTIEKPEGLADPVGLMERIGPFWWRATKATCLRLPPKRFERVYLELPSETAAVYRRVAEQGEAALGHTLSLNSEWVTMLRLQQIAGGHLPVPRPLDPASVNAAEQEVEIGELELGSGAEGSLDLVGAVSWDMSPLPCPKIDWLRQWALDVLGGDPSTRAIVWVRFNHELHRVADALRYILGSDRVATAYGATSNEEIQRISDSFNSRSADGVQVIVAQVKKLAYGHNLQAGDFNVYFSLSWSYVEHAQSQDRTHRLGREGAVGYIYLLCRGTVDEEIIAALDRKEDLAARLAPDTTSGCLGSETGVQ